jgi:exopolysaccharide biosynthesis predicted pyruvyltransferase EpsI
MKLVQPLIAITALAFSLSAFAQWQWIDKAGRKVFSARPPPVDVPEKNILKQPGMSAPAVETPASNTPATPAASATKATGEDKELAEKKKQAADAETARRRQEEERVARAQADNCNRARQAKASLDAGVRQMRINEKGEREFLDEGGRASEAQRLQGIIDENCK